MRTITIAGSVAVLLTVAATQPASAGSPYYGSPPARGRVADPAASGVPNVPDLRGCVKWCERDLDPCDPPLYKREDGRCNYTD